MINNTDEIIQVPELPSLAILSEIIDRVSSLSSTKELRKKIERYYKFHSPFQRVRITRKDSELVKILEESARDYLELMAPEIKQGVYSVIECLADFYGLDRKFRTALPDVELVDFIGLGKKFEMAQYAALDGGNPYPKISSYFQEPRFESNNQLISLNIVNGLPAEGIVEESLHFLQWFYESDEITHAMNLTCPGLEFLGLTEVKNSPIIRPKFEPKDFGRSFSNKISSEAIAYFTRVKFGLSTPRTIYEESEGDKKQKIAGIPEDKSPLELLNTLSEKGRLDCYRKLLDWNNALTLKELRENHHFQSMVDLFPSELIHYLGYGLGERLSKDAQTQRDLRYIGKTFFNSGDPEERLDNIVNMHLALSS